MLFEALVAKSLDVLDFVYRVVCSIAGMAAMASLSVGINSPTDAIQAFLGTIGIHMDLDSIHAWFTAPVRFDVILGFAILMGMLSVWAVAERARLFDAPGRWRASSTTWASIGVLLELDATLWAWAVVITALSLVVLRCRHDADVLGIVVTDFAVGLCYAVLVLVMWPLSKEPPARGHAQKSGVGSDT